jgi:hypothetical protein
MLLSPVSFSSLLALRSRSVKEHEVFFSAKKGESRVWQTRDSESSIIEVYLFNPLCVKER